MSRVACLLMIIGFAFTSCSNDRSERSQYFESDAVGMAPNAGSEEVSNRVIALEKRIEKLERKIDRLEKNQESGFLSMIFSCLLTVLVAVAGFLLIRKYRRKIWPVLEPLLKNLQENKAREAPQNKDKAPDEFEHKARGENGEGYTANRTSTQSKKAESSPPTETSPPPVRQFAEESENPSVQKSDEQNAVRTVKPAESTSFYAASPVNGFFMPNAIETERAIYTYYVIYPNADGLTAELDLVEDATLQQQVLDSPASHSEAIDFEGETSKPNAQPARLIPGRLTKSGDAWRITERIRIVLK